MMDRARALSQPALAVPRPAQPATPAGAPAAPVSDTAISMAAARRIAATDGGPALLSPLAAAGLLAGATRALITLGLSCPYPSGPGG